MISVNDQDLPVVHLSIKLTDLLARDTMEFHYSTLGRIVKYNYPVDNRLGERATV